MSKPLSINSYKGILFLLSKQKKARNKRVDRPFSKKRTHQLEIFDYCFVILPYYLVFTQ